MADGQSKGMFAQRSKFDGSQNKTLETLKNAKENLDLISLILSSKPEDDKENSAYPIFKEFARLLEEDYKNYANENDALAEEAEAYSLLQSVESDLLLVVNNQILREKNIIALGGGFSCGKSSFINSLRKTEDIRLPTGVNPVTAIPAYVISGNETSIFGHTYTGGKIKIQKEVFKKFKHDRMKDLPFMKSILPYITVQTDLFSDFSNLCFIDTPGYNPGIETESDRKASSDFIKKAKALIWMISVEDGTISDTDIDMLHTILDADPKKQIFIVCNKAELKSREEVTEVCESIADALSDADIPYCGIQSYSSNSPYNNQNPGSFKRNQSLSDFFLSLSEKNTQKASEFTQKIVTVFRNYIESDNKRMIELEQHRANLQTIDDKIVQEVSNKEAEAEYYKARVDRAYSQSGYNDSFEGSDYSYQDIIVEEIRGYKDRIEKYQNDKESAKILCEKMLRCVAKIFDIPFTKAWMGEIQKAYHYSEKYNEDNYDVDNYDEDNYGEDDYDVDNYDVDNYDVDNYDVDNYDEDDYDVDNYDEDNYGEDDYDKDGYDENGFNLFGYDENGFDRSGYDKYGYDESGYNKSGYNKSGHHKDGYDENGFDKNGFDRQGFSRRGFNKQGFNKNGFDKQGFDRQGFNKHGWDRDGFDRDGFNTLGVNKKDIHDAAGYDKKGYDAAGYDKKGYDTDGYDRNGYDRAGFDRNGYNRKGYNRKGFNQAGIDTDGYDTAGYDKEGYDRSGYNRNGYNKKGYDRNGRDRDGFNQAGVDKKGYNRQGYDENGYNRKGYDRNGYNRKGYNRDGYNKDGIHKGGYIQGYDRNGYDKDGYNRKGYDRKGYNRDGYNKDGIHKGGYIQGYDENGYDENGYDENGYDKDGYNKKGYDRYGYDRCYFDRDGYDRNGYNLYGVDRNGNRRRK